MLKTIKDKYNSVSEDSKIGITIIGGVGVFMLGLIHFGLEKHKNEKINERQGAPVVSCSCAVSELRSVLNTAALEPRR